MLVMPPVIFILSPSLLRVFVVRASVFLTIDGAKGESVLDDRLKRRCETGCVLCDLDASLSSLSLRSVSIWCLMMDKHRLKMCHHCVIVACISPRHPLPAESVPPFISIGVPGLFSNYAEVSYYYTAAALARLVCESSSRDYVVCEVLL